MRPCYQNQKLPFFIMPALIILSGLLVLSFSVSLGVSTEKALANELQASSISQSPTINKKSASLKYGDKLTLKANNTDGKKVTWKSSNSKICKIVKKGNDKVTVKALKSGSAVITGKISGKTLKCRVKVSAKLNKTSLTLMSYKNYKLILNGAKVKSWKSTNPTIVSVDKSGLLKTRGFNGSATITCIDNTGVKHKCNVKVKLPNISLKIENTYNFGSSSSPFICKKFSLFNKSNVDLLLDHYYVNYFPDRKISENFVEIYFLDLNFYEIGESNAIKIPSGISRSFYGYEGEVNHPITSNGVFVFTTKVDGVKCMTSFDTYGRLLWCISYENWKS